MKQGAEETKFVKEDTNPTRKYIFQKNNITKTAFFFVLTVLIFLVIAVFTTDWFL